MEVRTLTYLTVGPTFSNTERKYFEGSKFYPNNLLESLKKTFSFSYVDIQ